MNLNFTSPVHPVSAPRPTSFFIEDILLHKPKPLREVPPEHFPGSLASRVPLLDYGYPLMPTPTLLAPHPHPALHKPEHHHHPYFLTTSGKCSPSQEEPPDLVARWRRGGDTGGDESPRPRRGHAPAVSGKALRGGGAPFRILHRTRGRVPPGQEPPAAPGFVMGERSPPRCRLSIAQLPEVSRVSLSLTLILFIF